MFEIDIHGDMLEQKYSEFIKTHLSGYNKIWSTFIGNDGTAQLPDIIGLKKNEQKNRRIFSQYHYTCLESLICLYEIVENRDSLCMVNLQDSNGIKNYVNLMNMYIAFHAHAGRIKDLIYKMGNLYGIKDLADKLNEYFKRRNTVLHESKAPIGFIEGIVAILTPEGESSDSTKWQSGKLWTDDSNTSIEFINDYFEDTFREIVTITNNCLERLYSSKIAKIMEGIRIGTVTTTEYYGVSASGLPSSSSFSKK